MIESPTSGTRAAEPELSRVSVIGGNTQLDVGLPATVPIAGFIGDLVALIESRNPDQVEADDDSVPLQAQHWTLARIGQEAFAPSRTLNDADVHDGELLVLRSVTAKESPALFDDVIDAVSRLTAEEFRSWTGPSARWMGLATSVLTVLVSMALLVISRGHGDPLAPAFVLSAVGIGAFVAAGFAARKYFDQLTATWLSLDGLLLLFGGAALFVPGELGSSHLLLGSSVTLVAAVLGYRIIGAGATLFSAAGAASVIAGAAAAVYLAWHPGLPKLSAGLVVVGVALLSMVPRLAALLARLPIPPVPTAGAAIDPADHEQRPTIEGIGAIGATALPSASGLGERARAANQYQSGLIIACTLSAVIGAFGAADPLGSARWQGITLAVVTGIILCLRGRSFADLTQAATLIAGGCLTFVTLVVGAALGDSEFELVGVGLLVAFAAGTVGFGVIGPHIEVTPVTRRMIEIFEYLLIISLIPLVLWIMNVYSLARNI
ncbi:type VII secretion integral membrane protein EccD [Nocardia tenerifensis]|uniref:Type VII secretion integral membrane protein EccD n=1 Tax=Nocardia tenerifensis TaxID=228006 RepID=A0A318K3E0_9NOCA|nr:type VII secretion integral membrane protein EccD [Nocardia tenerifensis]PXX66574.1 type VII secretion integral membrane protein EccD [Nocardia tenerifensis]